MKEEKRNDEMWWKLIRGGFLLGIVLIGWNFSAPMTTLAQSYNGLQWEYNGSDSSAYVYGYSRAANNLEIPDYIIIPPSSEGDLPRSIEVNEIKQGSWGNITNLTIPANVQLIDKSAFSNSKNLKTVKLKGGVIKISDYAFSGCRNLSSINFQSALVDLDYAVFKDCTNLKKISIPPTVIDYTGFKPLDVNIEELVSAFEGSSIEEVVINKGVTGIPDCAFKECPTIKTVTIPDTVSSIGDSAFERCMGLQEIDIPSEVTNIGERAFAGCSNITEIKIPQNVSNIGEDALLGCSRLGSIQVSASNQYYTSINDVLFNKNKTTLIRYPQGNTRNKYTVPYGVEYIEKSAFSNFWDYDSSSEMDYLHSLTDIILPDSVRSIGERAFENSRSLRNVELPNRLTVIEEGAFINCVNLEAINIPNAVMSIRNFAFMGCNKIKSVTIPENMKFIGDRKQHMRFQ